MTIDTISPLTEIEIAGICVIATSAIIIISMAYLSWLSNRKEKCSLDDQKIREAKLDQATGTIDLMMLIHCDILEECATVKTNIESVKTEPLSEKQREFLSFIHSSSCTIADRIDPLRIKREKTKMDVDPVLVSKQCESILNAIDFIENKYGFSREAKAVLDSIVKATYEIENHMYGIELKREREDITT